MPPPLDRSIPRRRFLAPSFLTIAAVQLGLSCSADSQAGQAGTVEPNTTKDTTAMQQLNPTALPLPIEGELPSLGGAIEWLNSPPLTPDSLRGKVVLVEFCTYTCINWLRTLSYVRAWSEQYRDQGLVVIGVHTAEFGFEKDLDNVRRALRDLQVEYPIAVDSNYAVWRAFRNNYWPAIYLIDAAGRIRYHRFGEGEYERTEQVIQQLLAAAGHSGGDRDPVVVTPAGVEVAADWSSLRSPETYLGSQRAERFASPGGAALGRRRVYIAPSQLGLNQWALAGDWTVQGESAVLNEPNGRIAYRFHARDLHLVIGPARRGAPVRFRLLLDGQPPNAASGADVDDQGNGTIAEQRLYQLVRQSAPIGDRLFEIEFLDPGVEAFAFTFG
jgi:hypothetical protein